MKYSLIAPRRWPGSDRTDWLRRWIDSAAGGLLLAILATLTLCPARAGVRTLSNSNPTATGTDRSTDDSRDKTPAAPTNPNASLTRSTQPIPYQPGPFFAANRVGDPDVKLPPLPSSLYPVPPAERKPFPVVLPRPGLVDPSVYRASAKVPADGAGTTAKSRMDTNGNVIVGTSDTSEENIAVSPFITWINKTPNAADVARQSQEGYNISGVVDNNPNNADLFYNIRFPYTGSEQTPPGTGAVIYTTPKR